MFKFNGLNGDSINIFIDNNYYVIMLNNKIFAKISTSANSKNSNISNHSMSPIGAANESANEDYDESSSEGADEEADESASESVDEVADEVADEEATESATESATEVADESADEVDDEVANESTTEAADEPADESATESADKSADGSDNMSLPICENNVQILNWRPIEEIADKYNCRDSAGYVQISENIICLDDLLEIRLCFPIETTIIQEFKQIKYRLKPIPSFNPHTVYYLMHKTILICVSKYKTEPELCTYIENPQCAFVAFQNIVIDMPKYTIFTNNYAILIYNGTYICIPPFNDSSLTTGTVPIGTKVIISKNFTTMKKIYDGCICVMQSNNYELLFIALGVISIFGAQFTIMYEVVTTDNKFHICYVTTDDTGMFLVDSTTHIKLMQVYTDLKVLKPSKIIEDGLIGLTEYTFYDAPGYDTARGAMFGTFNVFDNYSHFTVVKFSKCYTPLRVYVYAAMSNIKSDGKKTKPALRNCD